MQQITVLGATGSIGASTLDVIARHPDKYRVYALTAIVGWMNWAVVPSFLNAFCCGGHALMPAFTGATDRIAVRICMVKRVCGRSDPQVDAVMAAKWRSAEPTMPPLCWQKSMLATRSAGHEWRLVYAAGAGAGRTCADRSEHNAFFRAYPLIIYGLSQTGVRRLY